MSRLSRTKRIVSLAQESHGNPAEIPSTNITSITESNILIEESVINSTDEPNHMDPGINENLQNECFLAEVVVNNGKTEIFTLPSTNDNMMIMKFSSSDTNEIPDTLEDNVVKIVATEPDCSGINFTDCNLEIFEDLHVTAESEVEGQVNVNEQINDSILLEPNEAEVTENVHMEGEPHQDDSLDESYVPEEDENGNSSDEIIEENGQNEGDLTIKKGKKRKRNSAQWKKNIRKVKKAGGQEHLASSGKPMKKKVMGDTCVPEKCSKECTKKISEENRLLIHSNFWNAFNTIDQKRQFIVSCIEESPVKRVRVRNGRREGKRKTSLKYFFCVDSKKVPVCRTFFLNTLALSQTTIRTALKKKKPSGIVEVDQRGRHEPVNKISVATRDIVREHIQKFPCVESHYSRKRSQRKYLGSHLNTSRMYSLFVEDCEEKGIPKKDIPKSWLYSDIFNTEFNLSFSQPSNDTCDLCDEFIVKLKDTGSMEQRQTIQEEYDRHLVESQKRYSEKRKDKEESQGKTNLKVIMVDLQKCLPTPLLHNAQSFYSLKLWSLNYTVYDSTLKKSSCFMWDESLAGRGGNEMASCLLRYITDLENSVEKLIIWSDNCPSQNRNMQMIVCYIYALSLKPSLKMIEHKYLLRGHTHMEVDTVHSRLEREQKKCPDFSIITPWDWQQMARLCSTKSSLEVKPMELEDFKDFVAAYESARSPFIQNKKTTTKTSFLISKVICMQFKQDCPGKMYFKCDLDKDFEEIDFNRKSLKKKQNNFPNLKVIRSTLRPISKKKYDDLQKLLKWVPKRFHSFYKDLPYEGFVGEDV